MRLISLNAWCGIRWEQLSDFIKSQSVTTDIFCFQEVRNGAYLNGDRPHQEHENFFTDVQALLPEHVGYYVPMVQGVGLASFLRKDIVLEKMESHVILRAEEINHLKRADGSNYYPRMMQSLTLSNGLLIHNFHGLPGGTKGDTPERELQADRILDILGESKPQMIVGDFNLDMNTLAVRRMEEGMINLVKEGGFKTTRNANYEKQAAMPFADFAFVTRDIKVKEFRVLEDEVSDHLPLYLDFSLKKS